MKRIFFDISDAVAFIENHASVNGIQRVVFSILQELNSNGASQNFITYYKKSEKRYVAFNLTDFSKFDLSDVNTLRYLFGFQNKMSSQLPISLRKYATNQKKLRYHTFRRNVNAFLGRNDHFARRGDSIEDWRLYKQDAQKEKSPPRPKPIDFDNIISQGDALVLLGAFWDFSGHYDKFQTLIERGIDFRVLIHDLIPLRSPAHVDSKFTLAFLNNIKKLMGFCDRFFTVSENTKKDLQSFLYEYGHEARIDVLPLVQHFPIKRATSETNAPPSETFARRTVLMRREVLATADFPYALCVGTMEGRKNNWGLLKAWTILLKTNGAGIPRLIFAGKKGWLNDAFFNELKKTNSLGGWVQIVENPSDDELAHLYENCDFTVFPSFFEGWGLPVGEGLSFGKTGVVANNSSLPEVGKDLVVYCDARSIEDIADKSYLLIDQPSKRIQLEKKIRSTKLRTWRHVADELLKAVE